MSRKVAKPSATVEDEVTENAVAPDGLNQPDTACSTDVRGSDLETAQRDQGDRTRAAARTYRLASTDWRRARKQRAFLEDYAQWGNLTSASRAAGVSRNAVYRWQETDEQFLAAFKQADAAATERLEREAWRRAVEGSPYERTSYWHGEPVGTDRKIEYSDQLMMLLLRARRPDLYREKVDLAVTSVVKTIAGVDPSSVL